MICRKEGAWHIYDQTSGRGKHLHLFNDARGGGIQNTKITEDGRFSVDGYVEEFQPHRPAHTQGTAELLCSYGPHFTLNVGSTHPEPLESKVNQSTDHRSLFSNQTKHTNPNNELQLLSHTRARFNESVAESKNKSHSEYNQPHRHHHD